MIKTEQNKAVGGNNNNKKNHKSAERPKVTGHSKQSKSKTDIESWCDINREMKVLLFSGSFSECITAAAIFTCCVQSLNDTLFLTFSCSMHNTIL